MEKKREKIDATSTHHIRSRRLEQRRKVVRVLYHPSSCCTANYLRIMCSMASFVSHRLAFTVSVSTFGMPIRPVLSVTQMDSSRHSTSSFSITIVPYRPGLLSASNRRLIFIDFRALKCTLYEMSALSSSAAAVDVVISSSPEVGV